MLSNQFFSGEAEKKYKHLPNFNENPIKVKKNAVYIKQLKDNVKH